MRLNIYRENEYLNPLVLDFATASKRIIIFCPFLNNAACDQLIPPLFEALERGVRVSLVTRNDMEAHPAFGQLKDIGIDVEMRPTMHQKLIIIDDSVCWFGSLNVLCYRESEELMMRISCPSRTQSLLHKASLPYKMQRPLPNRKAKRNRA
jgi:hypothetical protein